MGILAFIAVIGTYPSGSDTTPNTQEPSSCRRLNSTKRVVVSTRIYSEKEGIWRYFVDELRRGLVPRPSLFVPFAPLRYFPRPSSLVAFVHSATPRSYPSFLGYVSFRTSSKLRSSLLLVRNLRCAQTFGLNTVEPSVASFAIGSDASGSCWLRQ